MYFIKDPVSRNHRNRDRAITLLKKNKRLQSNNRFWEFVKATKKHKQQKKQYYAKKKVHAYGMRHMHSTLKKYGL